MSRQVTLKSIGYADGRQRCDMTFRVERPPGRLRRAFGLGPSVEWVEVFTCNYGRSWWSDEGTRWLDAATPELRGIAASHYSWYPTKGH